MLNTVPYTERKRLELREEIIDAAFEVFSERGYHDAAIADIAKRLGIGHGTFYRHFKNKRDILDHVIDGVIERALAALTAENAPEATTTLAEYRTQTERIVDALFNLLNEDPRTVRMLALQAGAVDAALEARLMDVIGMGAQIAAGYLKNGRDRGFLRADLDTATTAEVVVGLIAAGTLFSLRHGGDREHQERFKLAAIELMFDGVAPHAVGKAR